MTHLISFLREGTGCSFLQEMQLNGKLSQVTITHTDDKRTKIEHILPGQLDNFSNKDIDVGAGVYIEINYGNIGKAQKVWESLNVQMLYTFGASVGALTGLTVLKLCNVITTRLVFVAWVAMACFALLVFIRALELINHKPSFPDNYRDYKAQIIEFRKAIILRKVSLDEAKALLPSDFQARAAEFFTDNERQLLGIVKSSEQVKLFE